LDDLGPLPELADLEIRGTYGDPDLLQAIARFRGVEPDWVLPVLGASSANFIALATVANHGDQVLVETPVYDPLPRAARFLGLRPTCFPRRPEARHRPDLEAVERGLAGGAKAVLLTDLHNPSGLVCPRTDLEQLAGLAGEYGAHIIVDEVYLDYAHLNVPGRRRRPVAARLGGQLITTDSLTKVYGLGGLRAGWIIAHPQIVQRAGYVLDLLNVVNPVVSARLTTCALQGIERLTQRCRDLHSQTYPIYAAWLASRDDLAGYGHDGALFGWVRLPEGVTADSLANLLVTRYETNLVSGTFFGCNRHVRIGFGLAPELLQEGLGRVGDALDHLQPGRS
jgi:aspartate/methionine/tyrosine aminotransferase